MKQIYILLFFIPLSLLSQNSETTTLFFKHSYDENTGKVKLFVKDLDNEFLYINSLTGGVGSNDLGLDRGKINDTRIVKFVRKGNKLLLIQPNQKFRANSNNEQEIRAVEQAFASSVLWGFDIITKDENIYTIDITEFLLDDANKVANTLKDKKQGTYKLDRSKCAIENGQILSFPRNIEFESLLTFKGEATGEFIKSVTPSSDLVTIVQHQSFVALPKPGFVPRAYHPYSGFNNISYYDYASSIEEPLIKKYITRHRLEKVESKPGNSDVKEPIVYYVDSGCPEPIKGALMEGAAWWNQAFTSAGFKNAFIVKELPKDAHPLDVRYNVIQWVHRSTRGWSYGASVVDPRTGEIIKGHVSLGSLRVRQDFMIAQGILGPYKGQEEDHKEMKDFALARLRQLSAHEVGHTLGLSHNFAASTNNRSSVMDYPHPFIYLDQGQINLSRAYDDKIGLWDKRAITYGYTDIEEEMGIMDQRLTQILKDTKEMGLLYMSDEDARPAGSAHPKAHLWDNGEDPIEELKRILELRSYSLNNFGPDNIITGTPYSEAEKVIVPVFLMHRYQIEAVSKIIGGVDYNYGVKGFDSPINNMVSELVQNAAMQVLLSTLSPEALKIPSLALNTLLPAAKGYDRNRESFGSQKNMIFDPMVCAEALSNFVLSLMLHPERLSRVNQQNISLSEYINTIKQRLFTRKEYDDDYSNQLMMIPQKVFIIHLIKLASDTKIDKQISAMAYLKLQDCLMTEKTYRSEDWRAHNLYIERMIRTLNSKPDLLEIPSLAEMPPGSPIGCGGN